MFNKSICRFHEPPVQSLIMLQEEKCRRSDIGGAQSELLSENTRTSMDERVKIYHFVHFTLYESQNNKLRGSLTWSVACNNYHVSCDWICISVK